MNAAEIVAIKLGGNGQGLYRNCTYRAFGRDWLLTDIGREAKLVALESGEVLNWNLTQAAEAIAAGAMKVVGA